MARKRLIWLFVCCLAGHASLAQEVQAPDSVDAINAVKRDTTCLYAEATRKDAVEALSDANAVLELKVADWVRNQYPEEQVDTCVAKASMKWQALYSKRGSYTRVLSYVRKSDVVAKAGMMPDTPSAGQEPVAVLEEVMTPEAELTADEEQMAAIVSFYSIEPYVKELKDDGRIKAYGKYASLPEDESCHIFVYDKSGGVVAVLRQSEDGRQFNLQTRQSDNVTDYKNCGAIWLQLK